LWRFVVEFWSEAYTQHEFLKPGEVRDTESWTGYLMKEGVNMLEESAGFFNEWGFSWIPYYQLVGMTVFIVFGPCLLCL